MLFLGEPTRIRIGFFCVDTNTNLRILGLGSKKEPFFAVVQTVSEPFSKNPVPIFTPSKPTTSTHHTMNCPKCNVLLAISDRQGIEIDYCPQCRGVWLDRGELDKIIERTNQAFDQYKGSRHDDDDDDDRYRREHKQHHGDRPLGDHDRGGYRKPHKKSIWGDLFDLD